MGFELLLGLRCRSLLGSNALCALRRLRSRRIWRCCSMGAGRMGGDDGQRLFALGSDDGREPRVGRIQRMDRQRLEQQSRNLVQLRDGASVGRAARRSRKCLYR